MNRFKPFWPLPVGLLLALLLAAGLSQTGLAQAGRLTVRIAGLAPAARPPQVTAFVTVLDSEGLPVAGLAPAHFRISQPGRPESRPPLAVRTGTAPRLELVLALDLSLDRPADLEPVKAAALALLDSLEPRDSLTLITFHQEVELLFRGTAGQRAQVEPLIAALQPRGDRTAFYQAARQAVETLAGDSPGETAQTPAAPSMPRLPPANSSHREENPPTPLPFAAERRIEERLSAQTEITAQAIILVTNIGDNLATPAAARAGEAAGRSPIPLHLVSFGPRAKTGQLEALARQTRGRLYSLPGSAELPATLAHLGRQLRRGYWVTFQPAPRPDGPAGPVSIRVTTARGQTGQAQARLPLEPEPLTLALAGLQDLSLGRRLHLTAAVQAPAPVAWVSYRIDGDPAHRVTTAPYPFEWDSSRAEPGQHRLAVTVLDRAGRRAETELTFTVSRATLRPLARLEWGRPVILEAGPAGVDRVQFWLEERFIGQVLTAPYRLSLEPDHPAYPPRSQVPGRYVVTARVTGPSGQIARDSFTLEFIPPPAPPRRTGPVAGGILMAVGNLCLLPLLLLLGAVGRRRQAGRRLTVARLTFKNRGNLATPFRLTVANGETPPPLRFQLAQSEPAPAGLSPINVPSGEKPDPSPWQENATPGEGQQAPFPGREDARPGKGQQAPPPSRGRLGGGRIVAHSQPQTLTLTRRGENPSAADPSIPTEITENTPPRSKKERPAGGCVAGLVDFLDTVSSIPIAGAPFRAVVGAIRRGQGETGRLARMPKQIVDPIRRLGGPRPASQDRPGPPQAGPPAAPDPSPARPPVRRRAAANRPPAAGAGWQPTLTVETGPVPPGGALTLDLRLRPARLPARTRCYPVRLLSGPAGPDDQAGPGEERIAEESVEIRGIPRRYRLFPALAPLLVLLMGLIDLVWLGLLLWPELGN